MPVASINLHHRPVAREYKIRFSWQSLVVLDITKAFAKQRLPDYNLKPSILVSDTRHYLASCCLVYNIGHRASNYKVLSWLVTLILVRLFGIQ